MPEQPFFESPQEEPKLPTQEKSLEIVLFEKRLVLEDLADSLGFVEPTQMEELRKSIGSSKGINLEALAVWRNGVEGAVSNAAQGEDFVCAQVAFLALKATVYLDANMPDEFYEDIDDIITYLEGTKIDKERFKLIYEI